MPWFFLSFFLFLFPFPFLYHDQRESSSERSFLYLTFFRDTACRKPNGGKTIRDRSSTFKQPGKSGAKWNQPQLPTGMELPTGTSPVLPQRCPSTARSSTATVESDPAAPVLQAIPPRPVRKYTAAAVVACPLLQRIDRLMSHGECAEGYPWATPRQLEGRSVFEAFVACMQSGRGQQLSTAAVAATLLMARHGLSRKLACDHCKIPEGGSRTRVGTLAKQLSYICRIMPEESAWPELPSEWVPPPLVSAPAAEKTVQVQRYAAGWQAYMQLPEVPPPPPSTSTSTLHLYPSPPPSTSTSR